MSLLLHLINVMCACCIKILISFPKNFFTDPKLLNSSVYHNCMKKSGHYIHQHSTFVFHRGKNSGLEESEIWIYLLFCVSPPLCISVCRYANPLVTERAKRQQLSQSTVRPLRYVHREPWERQREYSIQRKSSAKYREERTGKTEGGGGGGAEEGEAREDDIKAQSKKEKRRCISKLQEQHD